MKAARDGWLRKFADVAIDRLVFLDEFGVTSISVFSIAASLRVTSSARAAAPPATCKCGVKLDGFAF